MPSRAAAAAASLSLALAAAAPGALLTHGALLGRRQSSGTFVLPRRKYTNAAMLAAKTVVCRVLFAAEAARLSVTVGVCCRVWALSAE